MAIYVKLENGKKGPLLAHKAERIVHGGRGDYLEIHPNQLVKSAVEIQPNQEWRLTDEWRPKVYYYWYRTKVAHRKVYYQRRLVNYADYQLDMVYIDPQFVVMENEQHA